LPEKGALVQRKNQFLREKGLVNRGEGRGEKDKSFKRNLYLERKLFPEEEGECSSLVKGGDCCMSGRRKERLFGDYSG